MNDTSVITITIPMKLRKRGGRKFIVTPDGKEGHWAATRPRVDNALVKAIARGFRWRRMIEDGIYADMEELAKGEKIAASYVGGLLRLTLLAPDIIEMILDGRQPAELNLARLHRPWPIEWTEQRTVLLSPGAC